MLADEVHAAFEHYRRNGLPQAPDVALMPGRREALAPSAWALRLTMREAMRLDRAVELGARGRMWDERDR